MIHTASFTKSYSLRGFALKEGSIVNVLTDARSNQVEVHGNLAHDEVKKNKYPKWDASLPKHKTDQENVNPNEMTTYWNRKKKKPNQKGNDSNQLAWKNDSLLQMAQQYNHINIAQ